MGLRGRVDEMLGKMVWHGVARKVYDTGKVIPTRSIHRSK